MPYLIKGTIIGNGRYQLLAILDNIHLVGINFTEIENIL